MNNDPRFILKNKKAVEYCRKSTESDERQKASLEDQHKDNQRTIESLGLNVGPKDVIKESRSAKKTGRPLFNKMVEDIQNDIYEVIVTWDLDRLARNSRDGGELIGLIEDRKLKAIVTPNKTYYCTSDNKLMLYIGFGMAEKFSDDLSRKVKRGMKSKIKRGWWPGTPKAGYKNVKRDGKEPEQVIDEKRFKLLRKAIDLFLTDNYSVADIVKKMNNDWYYRTRKTKHTGGTPISKSNFYKILKDPYYYGVLEWGDMKEEVNKEVPRLITEEEYWKIQDLLGNKGRPRPSKHNDLPFRSLIKCGECGSTWIPYYQKKKLADGTIKHYSYIRCNRDISRCDCNQKQMSISELENQIATILDSITISDAFCNWAVKWLKEENKEKEENHQAELERLENILNSNEKKLNRLAEGYLEEIFTKEQVKEQKAKIKKENKKIQKQIKDLLEHNYNWIEKVEKTFEFSKNSRYHFENSNYEDKTIMLKTLGTKFTIKDKRLLIKLKEPYLIIRNHKKEIDEFPETIKLDDKSLVTVNSTFSEAEILKWSG